MDFLLHRAAVKAARAKVDESMMVDRCLWRVREGWISSENYDHGGMICGYLYGVENLHKGYNKIDKKR